MTTDRVLIEGLTFFGYQGVRPEEQRLGQKFRVDVERTLDLLPLGDAVRLFLPRAEWTIGPAAAGVRP